MVHRIVDGGLLTVDGGQGDGWHIGTFAQNAVADDEYAVVEGKHPPAVGPPQRVGLGEMAWGMEVMFAEGIGSLASRMQHHELLTAHNPQQVSGGCHRQRYV